MRATGGLKDTVRDVDKSEAGDGFVFEAFETDAFLGATIRALTKYGRDGLSEDWREIMRCGMARDFSWDVAAREYLAAYASLFSLQE